MGSFTLNVGLVEHFVLFSSITPSQIDEGVFEIFTEELLCKLARNVILKIATDGVVAKGNWVRAASLRVPSV